jgi:hypothetical protein
VKPTSAPVEARGATRGQILSQSARASGTKPESIVCQPAVGARAGARVDGLARERNMARHVNRARAPSG